MPGPPAHARPDLEIRPLTRLTDLDQCVDLQRATWGDDFRELVPPALLTIVQKIGGIALGAFDPRDRLAGFVFGITGVSDHRLLHWSHMLAVDEHWRDRGVGRMLKFAQRDRLRAAGVTRARWTFDPLVARNAHINLDALGTQVIEYVENMYGDNPMSETDSVIGSDRFVVEWVLDGPRLPRTDDVADGHVPLVGLDHPPDVALPETPSVRVAIPRDIQVLKRSDPARARAWRAVTGRAFRQYLQGGYRVVGFHRGQPGARSTYLLSREREPR
jgi:predicted GNAT superfamily acetyltransferase